MEETTLSGPFRHLSCAGDNDTGEARLVPRARDMPGLQGAGSLVTNIFPTPSRSLSSLLTYHL